MKLFKYIALAFSSLFMCGCADYLDNAPDDTLTMEMTGLVQKTGSPGSTIAYPIPTGTMYAFGDTTQWAMISTPHSAGISGGVIL